MNTTVSKKPDGQPNSEHNKGEYNLWSDSNSFSESYLLSNIIELNFQKHIASSHVIPLVRGWIKVKNW